jgi:hypothetical protein
LLIYLGKTVEAQTDLARLQEVRRRRDAAAAQRQAEADGTFHLLLLRPTDISKKQQRRQRRRRQKPRDKIIRMWMFTAVYNHLSSYELDVFHHLLVRRCVSVDILQWPAHLLLHQTRLLALYSPTVHRMTRQASIFSQNSCPALPESAV